MMDNEMDGFILRRIGHCLSGKKVHGDKAGYIAGGVGGHVPLHSAQRTEYPFASLILSREWFLMFRDTRLQTSDCCFSIVSLTNNDAF